MALVVLSQAVQASIASLVAVATRLVPGAREASDHAVDGRLVTARLDVESKSVPIEMFAVMRDELARVHGFKHAVGDMRWICQPGQASAKLEVDILLSADETQDQPSGKKRAREDTGLIAAAPASDALALIGSAPKHMRAWFQEAVTSLDRITGSMDGNLVRHLDACRIPRVRMGCVQDAVTAFEAMMRSSCRISDRFTVVLTPVETDLHSACTCLEVASRGRTTVSVGAIERSMEDVAAKAGAFYRTRVVVTPEGACMRLDASNPACPSHPKADA